MNNAIAVIGNAGKDAESRSFGERTKIGFSLAVTKRVKRGDQWEDQTSWINCAVWCSAAQMPHVGAITTGTRVAVIGELETRKGDDGKYWTEIVAQFDGVLVGAPRRARNEEAPFLGWRSKRAT
jgi:single-stranded DNA-binding protein